MDGISPEKPCDGFKSLFLSRDLSRHFTPHRETCGNAGRCWAHFQIPLPLHTLGPFNRLEPPPGPQPGVGQMEWGRVVEEVERVASSSYREPRSLLVHLQEM
jgi:hypothetical protein